MERRIAEVRRNGEEGERERKRGKEERWGGESDREKERRGGNGAGRK